MLRRIYIGLREDRGYQRNIMLAARDRALDQPSGKQVFRAPIVAKHLLVARLREAFSGGRDYLGREMILRRTRQQWPDLFAQRAVYLVARGKFDAELILGQMKLNLAAARAGGKPLKLIAFGIPGFLPGGSAARDRAPGCRIPPRRK